MKAANLVSRLAQWLVLATGWQRHFTLLAAGLLSALAMPPFDFFPVLFITFPVLLLALDGAMNDAETGLFPRSRGPFLAGWWFGFGYFAASLWWIANALLVEADLFAWAIPLAVLAIPAGLALFWGLAMVVARLVWSDGPERILLVAVTLGIAEYLRGTIFTGFPWNMPGQALMAHPLGMQSAAIAGTYGVNAAAIFTYLAPAVLVHARLPGGDKSRLARRFTSLLAIFLLLAHAGFGAWRLQASPSSAGAVETGTREGARIRLMQPAIPQEWKVAGTHGDESVDIYLSLSAQTPAGGNGLEGTDILVWPESAFPFLLTERRDVLAAIGELLPEGTKLVTGALRAEAGAGGDPYGHVYNSVYVIADNGEIEQAADKVHLVPFGEYLPFQGALEELGFSQLTRIHGGFDAGGERSFLNMGRHGLAVALICYEIIFPGAAVPGGERPAMLINLTNDAWFGATPGPYQHYRQAVIRGVEEGLPVVRAANNGISAVTDALGREMARIGHGERGIADAILPAPLAPTPFARFGNMMLFGTLGLLAGAWLVLRLAGTRRRRPVSGA